MQDPRGKIMFTQREIKIGVITLTGTFPRMLVYVKVASRRLRDQFRNECKKLGIDIDRNEDGTFKTVQLIDGKALEYTRDEFRQVCRLSDRKEVYVKVPTVMVHFVPDGIAAYDAAGAPEALEALTKLPCVADAHYVLDVTAPRAHYEEKEIPTTAGPRSFINGKPAPRVPHEVRVKAQTEARRRADANVKFWENEGKRAQMEEFGVVCPTTRENRPA